MKLVLFLIAFLLTPATIFAQEAKWPGKEWKTASCPGTELEGYEFKKYGQWNSTNLEIIDNQSTSIEYRQTSSPDFHIRWINGDVEILCEKKYVFISTEDYIIIEIAYPDRSWNKLFKIQPQF